MKNNNYYNFIDVIGHSLLLDCIDIIDQKKRNSIWNNYYMITNQIMVWNIIKWLGELHDNLKLGIYVYM